MTRQILSFAFLILLAACNRDRQTAGPVLTERRDTIVSDINQIVDSVKLNVKANPDRFNEALALLDMEFGYQSQSGNGDTLYAKDDGVAPALINQFTSCGDQDARLNDIDFSLVNSVKKALVKSRETIDHMYLRVEIQEWQFESDSIATAFATQLNEVAMDDRECINKGGIFWWQIGDKLYLMTTPAFRFFFEFDKIRSVLNKKLQPN